MKTTQKYNKCPVVLWMVHVENELHSYHRQQHRCSNNYNPKNNITISFTFGIIRFFLPFFLTLWSSYFPLNKSSKYVFHKCRKVSGVSLRTSSPCPTQCIQCTVNTVYVCTKDPHCLTSTYSPTCLTANLALHHPPLSLQRQRALITLILRGLTRSIQSHRSIRYNHSHSLMRGGKRQTEKRETRILVKICSVFFSVKVELYHRFVF